MRHEVEGGFIEVRRGGMGVHFCEFEINGHSGRLNVAKDDTPAEAEKKVRERIVTAVTAREALPGLIREMQAAEDAYAAAGKIADMGTREDAQEDASYTMAEVKEAIWFARRHAWSVDSPGWSHTDRNDDPRDPHEIPEWPLINGRLDSEWMIGRRL